MGGHFFQFAMSRKRSHSDAFEDDGAHSDNDKAAGEAEANHVVKDAPPPKEGKRSFFSPFVIGVLRGWLKNNADDPYPSRKEMEAMAEQTGLAFIQIRQWFINYRRRAPSVARAKKRRTLSGRSQDPATQSTSQSSSRSEGSPGLSFLSSVAAASPRLGAHSNFGTGQGGVAVKEPVAPQPPVPAAPVTFAPSFMGLSNPMLAVPSAPFPIFGFSQLGAGASTTPAGAGASAQAQQLATFFNYYSAMQSMFQQQQIAAAAAGASQAASGVPMSAPMGVVAGSMAAPMGMPSFNLMSYLPPPTAQPMPAPHL
eukprot:Amastigsp_a174972_352.p1 type:complete len:311 gc:universal Amastigsp_a174972_352:1-933(+)